jgi:hypothetical protein
LSDNIQPGSNPAILVSPTTNQLLDLGTLQPTQPFQFLDFINPDTSLDADSDVKSDGGFESDPHDPLGDQSEYHHDDLPPSGVVEAYLASVKDKLVRELAGSAKPSCYQDGSFWITPKDGYFALQTANRSSDGLTPISLYYP